MEDTVETHAAMSWVYLVILQREKGQQECFMIDRCLNRVY
jgi:hypothetical protein